MPLKSLLCNVSYLAGHLFSLQGANTSLGLVLASQRSSVTVLLVTRSRHWVTTMARPPPQDTEHLMWLVYIITETDIKERMREKLARYGFSLLLTLLARPRWRLLKELQIVTNQQSVV